MSDPPEPHTCPRRLEAYGRNHGVVDQDQWERGHGLAGQDGVGASCSYCGSLNPARFIELVRAGWWVDPTDKAYKAYLAQPLNPEQVAERREQWMSGPYVARVRDAAREDHSVNVDAAVEREWQQMPAASGHGSVVGKFYYQHLSEAQQDVFIRLINAGELRIGPPGYFYVLPFFVQPVRLGVDG